MTEPQSSAPALTKVQAELLAREPIFHKPELGTTQEDYIAQTAEDFWEVGASGQVYGREPASRDWCDGGRFRATNTGS
jgi:hypothetical protein